MREFVSESDKAMLTAAWWQGALDKMDPKKFPKKPALLWDKDADRQSPIMLANIALMLASNGAEFRKTIDLNKLQVH